MKINMSKSLDKNNYISRIPFQLMNSSELVPLRREKILSKFSQEEINSCWESLCTNIIQNYQRGKGTLVKGFRTFTFKGTEINLEGTTNEILRDKKERLPVFLVSKTFNESSLYSSLNELESFQKDKLLLSMIYKKMNKKFLKKSKVKGLNRRENK